MVVLGKVRCRQVGLGMAWQRVAGSMPPINDSESRRKPDAIREGCAADRTEPTAMNEHVGQWIACLIIFSLTWFAVQVVIGFIVVCVFMAQGDVHWPFFWNVWFWMGNLFAVPAALVTACVFYD